MLGMLQRLMPNVAEDAKAAGRRITLYLVGLVFTLLGSGFLIAALHIFLSNRYGSLRSAIIIAVGALVLAGITFLLARSRKATRVEVPPSAPSSFAVRMADNLRNVGFRREALALRAGAEVMKDMRPRHYIAVVTLAGFIFGRRLFK